MFFATNQSKNSWEVLCYMKSYAKISLKMRGFQYVISYVVTYGVIKDVNYFILGIKFTYWKILLKKYQSHDKFLHLSFYLL